MTLVVIPARYGSSRFPGKPLAMIGGEPMVVRVARRAAEAVGPDNVLVATDDARIGAAVADADFAWTMTAEHATGTDRVWEAFQGRDDATVVNVQGDEPLLRPDDLNAVIAEHARRPDRVINAMAPIHDIDELQSPHVPKVVTDARDDLCYMSRAPIPSRPPSDPAAALGQRQICIYAFSPDQLSRFAAAGRTALERREDIEVLRFLDLGIPVRMVRVGRTGPAVDTPADLVRVEAVLRADRGRAP